MQLDKPWQITLHYSKLDWRTRLRPEDLSNIPVSPTPNCYLLHFFYQRMGYYIMQ